VKLIDLCIKDAERIFLDSVVESTPQSLLLVAEAGFGKSTIALALADAITNNAKYLQLLIEPIDDASSITIEQARQIKNFFHLKANDSSSKRVVIIDKADYMTIEAQNSLLKVLEEPPMNCFLILTSSRPQRLLPTIHSRLTIHNLVAPTRDELESYLVDIGYQSIDIEQTIVFAGTLPGLVVGILSKEVSSISESVIVAKDALSMNTLDRLKLVDKLSKNKTQSILLLESLSIISEAAALHSIENSKSHTKWANILQCTHTALSQLDKNASTKMVLTNLFLSM